jgi:hypothetical protein
MTMYVDWMTAIPNPRSVEVIVLDTDALLLDACGMLAGTGRSAILRAIDATVVVALMSEQAYLEVGRMYPKAARGRGVDENTLHDLIEAEYLPRIRVVTLPTAPDVAWVPRIDDVTDPDDIQHAQLARLVAPCSICSHDRHLRRPGYAPRDRATYSQLLDTVATVALYREATVSAAIGMTLTASGASAAINAGARRLQTKPVWVSLGALLVTATAVTLALRHPEHRRRAGSAAAMLVDTLGGAAEHNANACLALAAAALVPVEPHPQLEAQAAAFLARNPNSTITAIRNHLGSTAPTHPALHDMLRSHASFAMTRTHHWTLGSIRPALAA